MPPPSASPLLERLQGYQLTQMVYVAVTLGLPDLVADHPQSIDALAHHVHAHAPSLRRLLRALVAQGLFTEDDTHRYGLSGDGQLLRADVPGSVRPFVACYGEPWWWQSWGALLHGVRSGQTPFDGVHGTGFFDYLDQHGEARALFQANMSAMTGGDAQAVVDTRAFASTRVLVDLGAGHGALTTAVLRAHPEIRAIVFDQPDVLEGARAALDAAGVLPRCTLAGGSLFESVPAVGDTYVLKDILHDWTDGQALQILQVCRRAMPRRSRLLVIERLIGPDAPAAALVDVTMMVLTGGRERTVDEYTELLTLAGFEVQGVTATAGISSLVEAVPSPRHVD